MAEVYKTFTGFGSHQGGIHFDAELSVARLSASAVGIPGIDEGLAEEMERCPGRFGEARTPTGTEGITSGQRTGEERPQCQWDPKAGRIGRRKEGKQETQSREVAAARIRDGKPRVGVRADRFSWDDGFDRLRTETGRWFPKASLRAIFTTFTRKMSNCSSKLGSHIDFIRAFRS